MKRFFCMILFIALCLNMLPLSIFAQETDEEVIELADGSYYTVTIQESVNRASGTKTGNKTKTYYNSDGVAQWKLVVTGTFSYNGSSATCTASSSSVTILDSSWYTISKSATKSANTATANANMGKKVLGVTTTKIPATVTLSCDANGNLS